jgi:hypothetical protein
MVDVYDTKWHGRLVYSVQVVEMMRCYGVIKVPLIKVPLIQTYGSSPTKVLETMRNLIVEL